MKLHAVKKKLRVRMRSDCKRCRKWKERTYWSEFRVVQFFQILYGVFDQQLAIPQKFASNMRETLEASVSLTGPSGATWNVGLTPIGDTLFLKHGWKEFVDAHSLEEDDLLIFKYNGASKFDVSVFDRHSSCEKEAFHVTSKDVSTLMLQVEAGQRSPYQLQVEEGQRCPYQKVLIQLVNLLHMRSMTPLQQRNLSLHRLQHLVHGVLELMPICGLGKSKVSSLHFNLRGKMECRNCMMDLSFGWRVMFSC